MSAMKWSLGSLLLAVGLLVAGTLIYYFVRAGRFDELKCGINQSFVVAELFVITVCASLIVVGGALVASASGKFRIPMLASLAVTWMTGFALFVGFAVFYPGCPFPSR